MMLVNGKPGSTVDVLDRGLQYADGLFETIAIRRRQPRFFDFHCERLFEGCRRLGIEAPSRSLLDSEIARVITGDEQVVKLLLTRGASGRGYRPPAITATTRVVASFDVPPPVEQAPAGVRVRLCRTRAAISPATAGLKHLGRLEQVLARAEWCDESIAEGLMLDDRGSVVGGTQTNLIILRGGVLLTPPVDRCGVAGVMRRALLGWAEDQGMSTQVRSLQPDDLHAADEVLLTNALIGAWAVAELDGRPLAQVGLAAEFTQWLDRGD